MLGWRCRSDDLPKARRSTGLTAKVEFEVAVSQGAAAALTTELRQMLELLGLSRA